MVLATCSLFLLVGFFTWWVIIGADQGIVRSLDRLHEDDQREVLNLMEFKHSLRARS